MTASRPLVVDVDGTLVRGDLLHEAALQFLARHPLEFWRLGLWLTQGKAKLKDALSARVDPGIDSVPLRSEVLAAIDQARADGREIVLASASPERWVSALATRIGGARVMASSGTVNLAGAAKAQALVDTFGEGGFDYVGDAPVDLPVWKAAGHQLVVAHNRSIERLATSHFPDAEIVSRDRPSWRAHLKALRPHQWSKNLLVFLTMVAGHHFDLASVLALLLAFFCFCAAASSAYIINDLLDLPGDRDHPSKRYRPFASGALSPVRGIVMAAVLMLAALGAATTLHVQFLLVLSCYVVLTLGYSLLLKRRLIIDIIVLGGLYTIRVFGGVKALQQDESPWLLMFCLFLFLSLAAVKRCTELVARREAGKTGAAGRGYRVDDLAVLYPLASAAGYGAVLVVALYLSSPDVAELYAHPNRMWLICPMLLYWVSRIIVIASRNELHHDPVIFALTDRISWLCGAIIALIILVSI